MQSSYPVRKISDRQVGVEAFSSHTFEEMLSHKLWEPLNTSYSLNIVLLGSLINRESS